MAEGTRELILAAEAPANTTANSRLKVVVWNDRNSWDTFVEAHPEASNYHRWVWKEVIEETYGHRSFYLAAVRGAAIEGVLPLFWIRSRLFGQFLTSVPFFSYGGVLANSQEAAQALLAHAVDLARELGARHIELRSISASNYGYGWHHLTPKVTMVLSTTEDVDSYAKRLSSKMRQRIRFGIKHGLNSEWGGAESVGNFYRIFSINMRSLGTPVYPRDWFENICRHLRDQARILTINNGRETLAAGIVTIYRDGLEIPWSGSVPESRHLQPVVLMFWTLIEWATSQGLRFVDFGRCTPGGGVHLFKRLWLCEERTLHWHYWLSAGTTVPEMRPDNPRFRVAVRVWQRLPLAVTNWLGPRIVRSIP